MGSIQLTRQTQFWGWSQGTSQIHGPSGLAMALTARPQTSPKGEPKGPEDLPSSSPPRA